MIDPGRILGVPPHRPYFSHSLSLGPTVRIQHSDLDLDVVIPDGTAYSLMCLRKSTTLNLLPGEQRSVMAYLSPMLLAVDHIL